MPVILGIGPAHDEADEGMSHEEEENKELEAVADILLEAINSGDKKIMAKALKAAYMCCMEDY